MANCRVKFPCRKIKHESAESAKAHLQRLPIKYPDQEMAVYICFECTTIEQKEIWHVGHVRKNGTVYAKEADGKIKLRKVVINEHRSSYI